jgi:MraZ protein
MKEVAIDGDSGRLQIPKNLVDFAGIEKEVVLNAVFDKIEIWDKDKYEKVLAEGEKDYADLAEEIFADDE